MNNGRRFRLTIIKAPTWVFAGVDDAAQNKQVRKTDGVTGTLCSWPRIINIKTAPSHSNNAGIFDKSWFFPQHK